MLEIFKEMEGFEIMLTIFTVLAIIVFLYLYIKEKWVNGVDLKKE